MRSHADLLRICLGYLILSLSIWPLCLAAALIDTEALPAIFAFISAGSLIGVALYSIVPGTLRSSSDPPPEVLVDGRRLRHLLIVGGILGQIISLGVQLEHWPKSELLASGCMGSSLVAILVGIHLILPAFCATPSPDQRFEPEMKILVESCDDTILVIPDPQIDRLLVLKRRLKERGYR